ncbi:hypothetical protein J2X12_002465 [Pseudarthrobacter oxydans]|uniref:Transposase n=1 Tax=Pseudarthrobacter oxydans TaxID=1671 RepID=A0AAW8N9W2_PSEOX|nr:hypothetical protein [Pseudarthrobacter oxydans]MDR7164428.1 hypothetical protein [Pseudarthrobacter oxydans]
METLFILVEVLGCYSNRARWTIDKFDAIHHALDQMMQGSSTLLPLRNLVPLSAIA